MKIMRSQYLNQLRYSDFDVWTCLSPVMVKEIKLHLVPLLDSGIKDKDLVIAFDIVSNAR